MPRCFPLCDAEEGKNLRGSCQSDMWKIPSPSQVCESNQELEGDLADLEISPSPRGHCPASPQPVPAVIWEHSWPDVPRNHSCWTLEEARDELQPRPRAELQVLRTSRGQSRTGCPAGQSRRDLWAGVRRASVPLPPAPPAQTPQPFLSSSS